LNRIQAAKHTDVPNRIHVTLGFSLASRSLDANGLAQLDAHAFSGLPNGTLM
jgi:hypothetical protein